MANTENHTPPAAGNPSAVFRALPPRRPSGRFGVLIGAEPGKGRKNDSTASPETAKTPPMKLAHILLPAARARWMLPSAEHMTPHRIEMILHGALVGNSPRAEQDLYSLMESTWPRLLKNRMEVVDGVLGLQWQIMDAPEDEQVPGAESLITRAMNGMRGDPTADGQGWRATLSSLLDAWFRGTSLAEIEWQYRPGSSKHPAAWLPLQTRDVPSWHWGWSRDDGKLKFYPDADPEQARDFPEHKFLIAVRKAGKGHPSGTALLRTLAWFWCAANFSRTWLLNFAQIFGQPFRWATYDPSDPTVADTLSEMMEHMGSAAWGIGPTGTEIEWKEAAKSGADNPQNHMLNLADTACDLLILGQTLTTSVGDSGSRALGEVHQSVRADIIDSAAQWLAEILNEQLIPALIAVNYGELNEDSRLPWFLPARQSKKDAKLEAEIIKILGEAGIPLVKDEVYERIDMSRPDEGDEVFFGASDSEPPELPPELLNAAAQPTLRRVLAKMPLDAREYFMARLMEDQTDPTDPTDPTDLPTTHRHE